MKPTKNPWDNQGPWAFPGEYFQMCTMQIGPKHWFAFIINLPEQLAQCKRQEYDVQLLYSPNPKGNQDMEKYCQSCEYLQEQANAQI